MSEIANTGPLAGVRIVDLTRILAGPSSAQLMGDLGADVIKIERPGAGDDTRKWGPPFLKDDAGEETTESAYYLAHNRNKRSVAIDIAKSEGAELVCDLCGGADIFMENFKTGGLDRYGLGWEDMNARFPRLIYCSVTGFGQTGPNAHRAGYDFLAQGMGGLMSITGEKDGEPQKSGVAISDILTGLYASIGILAALRHRDATGHGQRIDLALVDSMVASLVNQGTYCLVSGEAPGLVGNAHPSIVPYQLFKGTDGYAIIACGNDRQFERLCGFIGKPELATDTRFARNRDRVRNRDVLVPLLAEGFAAFSKQEILAGLEAVGVPAGPVNNIDETFAEPQIEARDMRISMPHPLAGNGAVDMIGSPLKLSESPVSFRRPPPVCGQHTCEVLREVLGISDTELARLAEGGIIEDNPVTP